MAFNAGFSSASRWRPGTANLGVVWQGGCLPVSFGKIQDRAVLGSWRYRSRRPELGESLGGTPSSGQTRERPGSAPDTPGPEAQGPQARRGSLVLPLKLGFSGSGSLHGDPSRLVG